MTRQTFDNYLLEIQGKLLRMGTLAEEALFKAIDSLKQLDPELAQLVVKGDSTVNDLESEIQETAVHLIATQQPVAKDLRKIVAAIQIASNLERMSDLAVDIAKVTLRLQGQKLIKPLVDIPKMADLAEKMIKDGLTAYIEEDVQLAQSLAHTDDQVDKLYKQILNDLFEIMTQNPATINQGVQLSFVGRFIERIGDHATNIGESVIYLVKGKKPDLNS